MLMTALQNLTRPYSSSTTKAAVCVVVIDDDPDILDAFSQLLRLEGYAVQAHACARDYLQTLQTPNAQNSWPACILCDVMMPEIDGLQLQAMLGQMGQVSILLMSGASGVSEVIQAFRAGATDFLVKPISNDLLTQSVARAVAATQQRRQKTERFDQLSQQVVNLSAREWQVMRMVAAGMTNLGISLELDITERTVKFHRQRLLEKLGLNGTADLARLYQELNQLGLDKSSAEIT
jgi:FixJ family two-component response regulator